MNRALIVLTPAVIALVSALTLTPVHAADPASPKPLNGAALYAQNCARCHSLDRNGVAPKHRGIVGRRAGTVPGYAYSPALKASGIVWTAPQLDRWLQGPAAMVPGTKMNFRLTNPAQRAAIIAYLATQK